MRRDDNGKGEKLDETVATLTVSNYPYEEPGEPI